MRDSPFFKQADLLVQAMPFVNAEECFGLKGGIAKIRTCQTEVIGGTGGTTSTPDPFGSFEAAKLPLNAFSGRFIQFDAANRRANLRSCFQRFPDGYTHSSRMED